MKRSLLFNAMRTAINYIPKHPQRKCYLHFTFIIKNNQILEWATNTNGVPPRQFGYHDRIDGGAPKSHSEINAYRKARGLLKGEDFSCINIRLSKRGEMRISAPCNCCYTILKDMGCNKFWYTTSHGWERING